MSDKRDYLPDNMRDEDTVEELIYTDHQIHLVDTSEDKWLDENGKLNPPF